MKKSIIIILLMLLSCGVTKDKIKTKSETKETQVMAVNTNKSVKKNLDSTKNLKDSTVENRSWSTVKADLSVLQNFTLRNSGKCDNAGETRFVSFTDAAGNKTNIPVNNNTELNFGTSTDFKKQIETLKIELSVVKAENTALRAKIESNAVINQKSSRNQSASNASTNVKTKKSSLPSFAFVGLLSIVVYELIRQLIKKLIPLIKR